MNYLLIKTKRSCAIALFILAFLFTDSMQTYAQVACSCNATTPFGLVVIQSPGVTPIKVNCSQSPDISTFSAKCNATYTITDAYFSGCGPAMACMARVEHTITGPGQSGVSQPVSTPFTLTANGTYAVTVNGKCGNTLCQKCEFRLIVTDCAGPVNCCPGKWTQLSYTPQGAHPLAFKCGDSINAKCDIPIGINAVYGSCPRGCDSNVTYSVSGGASITANGVFTATANGTYMVTINGMCGGKVCTKCTLYIKVTGCPTGNMCCPGRWTDITLLEGYVSNQPIATLNCGKSYDIKCNIPYTINGDYICNNNQCNGYIGYKLSVNNGPFYANSGTFTATATGTYTLIVYGICNGDTCEKCPITFKAVCDSPTNCCPGKWRTLDYARPTGNRTKFKCGDTIKAECRMAIDINAIYGNCPRGCDSNVTYSVTPGTATINTAGIFTATANGVYKVEINGMCGGKVCNTCVLYISVIGCPQASCCPGTWSVSFNPGTAPQNNATPVSCGSQQKVYIVKCNEDYFINASYICPRPCRGNVAYSVSPAGATMTGQVFRATQNGIYTISLTGACDQVVCEKCTIMFKVTGCDSPTNCCPGKWGNKVINEAGATGNEKYPFDCKKEITLKCKTPYQFVVPYTCPTPCGPGKVTYSVTPSGATISATGLFTASANGTYTVTMYGSCKNTLCDSCKVYITIKGCPQEPENCCTKKPTVTGISENTSQQTTGGNAFTLYTANIQMSGGTGSYQEIKASVVSFKLNGNYEQCISCKNKPFTWGSISGSTLAGILPATTGATPPTGFNVPANPTENPREIVWNNGSIINLSTPQSVTLNVYLPAAPSIPCCDLSADICIKISYKDIDCVVCEEVFYGKIILKKEGVRSDDSKLFNGK